MDSKAKVVLCEQCREHGRIVFANGTQTREFWTRHMGFDLIISHQEAGNLNDGEASELGRHISASGLPRDGSEIEHSDKVCPDFKKLLDQLSQMQKAPKLSS